MVVPTVKVQNRHKPIDGIRRRDWFVDEIEFEKAVDLVERLHYTRSTSNSATFKHGLFKADTPEIPPQGVAIWIPPTKDAANAAHPENWRRVLALSRLVIEPNVPTNGASFLLSRSVQLIKATDRWDCLVTYADQWQGHTGAIYKACGWKYTGLTQPGGVYQLDGRTIARKAGPKTRTHADMIEMGCEYLGSFAKHRFVHKIR